MKHTEDTKKKLSKMRTGKGNPFWGKKHTAAVKRKMAQRTRTFNLNRTYSLTNATVRLPTGLDLGYFAGLIDGEGSIRFHGKKGRYPFVAIYNSDEALKDWLTEKTGIEAKWTDLRGRVPGWAWQAQSAANVYRICIALLPFLIVKKEDARKVIDFLFAKYRKRIVRAANG